MGLKKAVRGQLQKLWDKNYKKKRKRYQYQYASWVQEREQEAQAGETVKADRDFVRLSFGEGSWSAEAEEKSDSFLPKIPRHCWYTAMRMWRRKAKRQVIPGSSLTGRRIPTFAGIIWGVRLQCGPGCMNG